MTDQPSPIVTRLWREESQEPLATPRKTPSRRAAVFTVLALMLALGGTFVGLLSWLKPAPSPLFVPLWVSAYESRHIPLPAWSAQDRAALTDAACFVQQQGKPGQERHLLLQQLQALQNVHPKESVVVYVSAQALRNEQGAVALLPADADPDNAATRLPLQTVLQSLKDCPAQRRLLVLDIMRPVADARLGVLSDDVAQSVQAEVEATDDAELFVLCSCGPGQVALTSEALGRSVFSHYLEEGLRGRADGYLRDGRRDGQVSVRELAAFLRARVDRWAVKNRDTRQTPILLGSGKDFRLRAADTGEGPRPVLALPNYPAWLLDAWKARAGGDFRLAPRLFREQEAILLQAERSWRGGVDAGRLQETQVPALQRLQKALAEMQPPRPEPRSLALAGALGDKADEPLSKGLQEMLDKARDVGQALKADDADKARAKLGQDFQEKLKGKSAFALSWACFEAACAEAPDPARLRLLDGLLRAARPDAEPAFVETLLLRLLAERSTEPGATWQGDEVRRLLEVTRRGEKAASRARAFPWVGHLLEQAAQDRHNGAVCFWARGYASLADADRPLKSAADRYENILSLIDILEDGQAAFDEATLFLPAYLPYLEALPESEAAWLLAAQAAGELHTALIPPADAAAQLRLRIMAIQQHTSALRDKLRELQRPFGRENLTRLTKLAEAPGAVPSLYAEIDAVLATPFPRAEDRAELCKAAGTLARRLQTAVAEADQDDDEAQETTLPQSEYDPRRMLQQEHERGILRARASVALLKFAGLTDPAVRALQKNLTEATAPNAPPAKWYALGEVLRRAWAKQLFEQFDTETSLYVRDRRARMLPPFDTFRVVEGGETTSTARLLTKETQGLWNWLADRCRYEGRDFRASAVDPILAPKLGRFYAAAAASYESLGRPPRESYAQWGNVTVPRLTSANPKADIELSLTMLSREGRPSPDVRVLTPDDWLAVRSLGTKDLKVDASEPALFSSSALLHLELKEGAERSRTPRPRGILMQAQLGGRTYHQKVDVPLQTTADQLQLLLSAEPGAPELSLDGLRLRPGKVRQPFYLFVRNPTDRARKVTVQVSADGLPLKGAEATLTVEPGTTKPVRFGDTVLSPKDDLPRLSGPLQLFLSDADNKGALIENRLVPVDIASPREYVQVTDIKFDPAAARNQGKNSLAVTLQTVRSVPGPEIPIELVLSHDRIPSLREAKAGTFSGHLKAQASKTPQPLRLFAEDILLLPAADENGSIYLNVDGHERSFLFRTTFAREGDPTTPRGDGRPAIRLRIEPQILAGPKTSMVIEVDNAPATATLEFALGRFQGGLFEADVLRKLPTAKDRRIGFSPQGPGGALTFEAAVKDWEVVVDTSKILGRRVARARLLDETGAEIEQTLLALTVDNTPPEGVKLVKLPEQVVKGTTLPVRAVGADPESGVAKVVFFLGALEDGKVPPKTHLIRGEADAKGTAWVAKIALPADRKGPQPITVLFTNQVGLVSHDTATVELLDTDPTKTGPGKIEGTVYEGRFAQPNLDVVLRDPKGVEKARTKTKDDGTFVFPQLEPGRYTVYSVKPATLRRGNAAAVVEPAKTAKVRIDLTL